MASPEETHRAHEHRHVPPNVRLSLRAAFCLTSPLVVGLVTGQRSYGTLVAIGALWGVGQDGLDRWRVRAPRLLGVAVAAGVGIVVGSEFVTRIASPEALVVLLGLMAIVAGFIEASLWSSTGMYLLLGAIIGGGLGFAGRTWEAAVAITAGALWVYLVAGLTDWRSRVLDQRASLFHAYRALANLLEGIETDQMEELRARAVRMLDTAQDVVGTEGARPDKPESIALYQCFIVALQIGEVSSYLAHRGEALDATVGDSLREIGAAIRYGTAADGIRVITRRAEEFSQRSFDHHDIVAAALRFPPASALIGAPPFRSTIARLPIRDRIRFALILAVAVVIAAQTAHWLQGPKGYWLAMSVAFIFRPDLGPVMRRAVARTVGTLAGVAIAALVSLSGNSEGLLIVLCCVMAASVPWAVQRSHALAVMVFTPIVFVFIGVVGSDQNLFVPRIVDTVIAAGIALCFDYVLWLHAPSMRPRQLVDAARRATEHYLRTTESSDAVSRHSLRRNALRVVAQAREALAQADAETHLFDVSVDATLATQLSECALRIDDHTASLITNQ